MVSLADDLVWWERQRPPGGPAAPSHLGRESSPRDDDDPPPPRRFVKGDSLPKMLSHPCRLPSTSGCPVRGGSSSFVVLERFARQSSLGICLTWCDSPAAARAACHHRRMRLDEEKLEALRAWGEKLGQAEGDELPAVGRAILMLVEEIDRLHVDLWHARMQSGGGGRVAAGDPAESQRVASSLHARLRHVLRRHSDAPTNPQPVERRGDNSARPT
jgi:hypothetical protein